jgi:hypothetical protein
LEIRHEVSLLSIVHLGVAHLVLSLRSIVAVEGHKDSGSVDDLLTKRLAEEQQGIGGVEFGGRVTLLTIAVIGHLDTNALLGSSSRSLGSNNSFRRWLYLRHIRGRLPAGVHPGASRGPGVHVVALPRGVQVCSDLLERGVGCLGPRRESRDHPLGHGGLAQRELVGAGLLADVRGDLLVRVPLGEDQESLPHEAHVVVEQELVVGGDRSCWCRWSDGEARCCGGGLVVGIALVFGGLARVLLLDLRSARTVDTPDASSHPRRCQTSRDLPRSLADSRGVRLDGNPQAIVGDVPGYDLLAGGSVDIRGDVSRGVSRGHVKDRVAEESGGVREHDLVCWRHVGVGILVGNRWGGGHCGRRGLVGGLSVRGETTVIDVDASGGSRGLEA